MLAVAALTFVGRGALALKGRIVLIIGNTEYSLVALKDPESHARFARAALRRLGLPSITTWGSQRVTA